MKDPIKDLVEKIDAAAVSVETALGPGVGKDSLRGLRQISFVLDLPLGPVRDEMMKVYTEAGLAAKAQQFPWPPDWDEFHRTIADIEGRLG